MYTETEINLSLSLSLYIYMYIYSDKNYWVSQELTYNSFA